MVCLSVIRCKGTLCTDSESLEEVRLRKRVKFGSKINDIKRAPAVVLFSACDVLCTVSYLVERCFKLLSAAYRCYVCRTWLKGPQYSVCALDTANGVGCELG